VFAESVMVLRQRGNEHNGFSSWFVASLPGSLLLCLRSLLHPLRTQKIPVIVYFEDEKIRDDECSLGTKRLSFGGPKAPVEFFYQLRHRNLVPVTSLFENRRLRISSGFKHGCLLVSLTLHRLGIWYTMALKCPLEAIVNHQLSASCRKSVEHTR
jgi:hypothetical protein